MAITAVVLGSLSVLAAFLFDLHWLAIPLGLVAAFIGMRARRKFTKAGQPVAISTAGLALGAAGFALGLGVHLLSTVSTENIKDQLEDPARDARFHQEFKDTVHRALADAPAPNRK